MELAVWTHYILYDLKPELLEDMPTSKVEAAPAATAGMNFHNSFKQNQYTQYPIIRNGTEFWAKFKKRALGTGQVKFKKRIKELKKRSLLRFSKLRNEKYLSLVCNFKIFFIFILECSTLSVELNFIIIAVFLAKLANLSCSIMAYVVMAGYFWKNLRNGQHSNLKN